MNGLEVVALEGGGWVAGLFGRKPKENAPREVQNYLARTRLEDISAADVWQLIEPYGLKGDEARSLLKPLYTAVLRHFACDHELADIEISRLRKLRDALGLTDADIRDAEESVFDPILRREMGELLRDDKFTREEEEQIRALAKKLRLPDEFVRNLMQQDLNVVAQRVFDKMVEDRRVTPEEDRELAALAEQLGAQRFRLADDATVRALDRFRLLWRLEQGELPTLEAPFRLKRNEQCHASVSASHHELRTVTRRINYSGLTYRFRIIGGLSWRAGSISPQRVTDEILTQLDTGTLHITSSRLLFDGSKKSTTIPYRKIINFTLYSDGIKVEKETGKDQVFQWAGDSEVLGTVLQSALKRA